MTEETGCPVATTFDPFGAEYRADPARVLGGQEPVFYSPILDCFVVTRHEDVRAIYRNAASFSSSRFSDPITPLCPAARQVLDASEYRPSSSLATTDGPVHGERRKRLERLFRSDAMASWEGRIREVYAASLDQIVTRGRADLVSELFWEPPARLAIEFMGLPDGRSEQLKQYASGLLAFVFGRPSDDEQVEVCSKMGDLYQYGRELLARLKDDPSGSGLLASAVRIANDEPDLFDDAFLISLITNTLPAAHETTSTSLTNGMLLLLRDRAAWDDICSHPELIGGAVEECLRAGTPLTTGRRLCVRDTVINDVTIPAGAMVVLGVASANYDEAVFPAPFELDLSRAGARRHFTFGFGPHYCLGAPFARLQMTVAIGELARRLPDLELVPDQPIEYAPSLSAWSPRQLLVQWNPARRA